MIARGISIFGAIAIGLVGCFTEPSAAVQFSCDPQAAPACPDGYTCEADRCCHRDGTDVMDAFGACHLAATDGLVTLSATDSDTDTGTGTGTDGDTDTDTDAGTDTDATGSSSSSGTDGASSSSSTDATSGTATGQSGSDDTSSGETAPTT